MCASCARIGGLFTRSGRVRNSVAIGRPLYAGQSLYYIGYVKGACLGIHNAYSCGYGKTYVLSFAFLRFSRNFKPISVVDSGVSAEPSAAPWSNGQVVSYVLHRGNSIISGGGGVQRSLRGGNRAAEVAEDGEGCVSGEGRFDAKMLLSRQPKRVSRGGPG